MRKRCAEKGTQGAHRYLWLFWMSLAYPTRLWSWLPLTWELPAVARRTAWASALACKEALWLLEHCAPLPGPGQRVPWAAGVVRQPWDGEMSGVLGGGVGPGPSTWPVLAGLRGSMVNR